MIITWIGIVRPPGSQKTDKGAFKYIDGSGLYADRWLASEPGNSENPELCGMLYRHYGNVGWADDECWRPRRLVCQKSKDIGFHTAILIVIMHI